MRSWHFRWLYGLFLLPVASMFAIKSVLAQQAAPPDEKLRAKLDDAALVLDSPRLKGLSPKNRQALVEFVAGNMLFVLLHELAHAAVADTNSGSE
jgi:hypothetical protein